MYPKSHITRYVNSESSINMCNRYDTTIILLYSLIIHHITYIVQISPRVDSGLMRTNTVPTYFYLLSIFRGIDN